MSSYLSRNCDCCFSHCCPIPGPGITPVYGQVFLDVGQDVLPNTDVIFNNSGVLNGIVFAPPSSSVFLPQGDYAIDFQANVFRDNDEYAFGIVLNNVLPALPQSRFGERTTLVNVERLIIEYISGSTIVRIPLGGAMISLRNIGTAVAMLRTTLNTTNVNAASLRIIKIG